MTWKPYIGGHIGAPRPTETVAMLSYDPGKLVLVATADGSNHGDDEANARLIAAAPDMLEALRMACRALHDGAVLEAVRAAIRKAEREAGR